MTDNNDKKLPPGVVVLGGGGDLPDDVMDVLQQMFGMNARPLVNPLAVNTFHTHNPANHAQISELVHVVELPRGVEEANVSLETQESFVVVTAKRAPLAADPSGGHCPDIRRGIADTFQAGLPAFPNVSKGDLKVAFDKAGTMTVSIAVPASAYDQKPQAPQSRGGAGFGGPGGPKILN